MNKKITKNIIFTTMYITLILLTSIIPVYGFETIISPINDKVLVLPETSQKFSFFAVGHIYGAPGSASVFPSSTLLANIEMINNNNAKFIISMGDNFQKGEEKYIESFIMSTSSKIEIPMFNAVGNHDVIDRELYESYFGQTNLDFRYGSNLFIILDTEKDNGEIIGEQLNYLNNTLNYAIKTKNINNVFIISHKLIWCVNDEELEVVYQNLNGNGGYAENDNFKNIVLPEIIRTSKTKNIYMLSGDIGVGWSLPLFYHKDTNNIIYIATGLGDTEKDTILHITVSKEGLVAFKTVSLTGEESEDLKHYDIDYWNNYFENKNKITDKIMNVFKNRYFHFGVLFNLMLVGFFVVAYFLLKR